MDEEIEECPKCLGTGNKLHTKDNVVCSFCNGTGEVESILYQGFIHNNFNFL